MKRVLYGVSSIGLGHATRATAVAALLRAGGVDVLFASGGNAVEYLRGAGFAVEDVVREPVPAVVDGEMKRASLWYLSFWRGYRSGRKNLQRLIDHHSPDLIVGDEEFAGVSVAMERGLPHVLVTDELELGFARTAHARAIESRASGWYSSLLSKAAMVVIPDFGEDSGNRRYIGPIVRPVTEDRRQVVAEHGLPGEGQMVLLSLSGSGIGAHLVGRTIEALGEAGLPGVFVVVSGNRGRRFRGPNVFDLGVVADNQNLVAAADLVVSNAGKSTIDEARSSGTPIIAVPIRHHAEQERNALALGFRPGDEQALGELIKDKIGKREAPLNYRGAEKASQLLLSTIG